MKRLIILIMMIMIVSTMVFGLGNDSSLLAHYKMEGLADSSGNGNTLTNNGATLTSSNCQSGSCYDFDGATNYMDTGFTGNDVNMTLSAWGDFDTVTTFMDVFSQYDTSAFGGYALFKDSSDYPFFYAGIGANKAIFYNVAQPVNKMIHYVLSYDGTTMRMYINGSQVNSSTGPADYANPNNWLIGSSEGVSNFWDGTIDEVSLWDRTLNSTEILDLYNNGINYGADATPPVIAVSSYNMTSSGGCINWRTNQSNACQTFDTTPTFSFTTDEVALCRSSVTDINYTAMNSSRDCSTTNSTIQVCSIPSMDSLSAGNSNIYASCTDSGGNENALSTSGALAINIGQTIQGFVLDDNSNAINGANVILIDQSIAYCVQNTTSNSTGAYFFDIFSVGQNYTVVGYDNTNSSRDGDASPNIITS